MALSTVVVVLAAAEAYAAFRRSGSHPATLLGLVATGAAMVAAYAKGVAALPLVLVLLIVTSMVWYLVGAERGSPVAGISATVLGFAWVGLLGFVRRSDPRPQPVPRPPRRGLPLRGRGGHGGGRRGALAIGGWRGRHPLAPAGESAQDLGRPDRRHRLRRLWPRPPSPGRSIPARRPRPPSSGLVVAVLAPVGDLCESLIKRDLG